MLLSSIDVPPQNSRSGALKTCPGYGSLASMASRGIGAELARI
jgi:hypothetical protein